MKRGLHRNKKPVLLAYISYFKIQLNLNVFRRGFQKQGHVRLYLSTRREL